jgi:hypothetical protein
MTKARDLAGFSTSSITNTATDGLVLAGDGSSTDVVIKNGANATVASIPDGSTNLSVTGSVTGALAQGAIQVGNSSGVAAPLTIGSNAQLLQSNGTTAAWATVSSGPPAVVFPSDWTSPNNNYTSSGVWSQGSLSDDDYVLFLLVGGGGGGQRVGAGSAHGGIGGRAKILFGKAKVFNGGAYVVGAGVDGATTGTTQLSPSVSSFTLTSTFGSQLFATSILTQPDDLTIGYAVSASTDTVGTGGLITSTVPVPSVDFKTLPSGYSMWNAVYQDTSTGAQSYAGVFGAGGGGWANYSANTGYAGQNSLFSGNGGAGGNSGENGTAPGGGGGGCWNNGNTAGNGADGSVRVYHV